MPMDHADIYTLKADTDGELLIDLLKKKGLAVESNCQKMGTCGKCKIKIIRGAVSSHLPEELEMLSKKELQNGIRLACLCHVKNEIEVIIPQFADQMRIQEKGRSYPSQFHPVIKKSFFAIDPQANQSLLDAFLKKTGTTTDNRFNIVQFLGRHSTAITAISFKERLIGVETGDTCNSCYGVAVDIGTTTMAAELVDLNKGKIAGAAAMINPQLRLGADVLSRISFARQHSDHLQKLAQLTQEAVNELIRRLFARAGLDRNHCYLISAAGNTVMLHLLLGVSPSSLGCYPYRAVFLEPLQIEAVKVNIEVAPFAVLQSLPGISGFIGADITAGLLALDLINSNQNTLFLDMGTNGEIVICYHGQIIAASTAAGPALEGMNISCGMRATCGAIEQVTLCDGDITYKTIGNTKPQGLCGSGLLDLVAVLLQAGIIQPSGRMVAPKQEAMAGVIDIEGSRAFQLIKPCKEDRAGIHLTQKDVRQVQLAKGALATGIKLLLDQAGLQPFQIETVYLAGGFGYYLNTDTLLTLGLFPKIWQDRLIYAGNTSLAGARLAMLDEDLIGKNMEHLKKVAYCDLNRLANFNQVYARAMMFGGSIFE